MEPLSRSIEPDDTLDAYSRSVIRVVELVMPAVASLQVMRAGRGGRRPAGSGSAVAITPDGFAITSAHVVSGSSDGTATISDGRVLEYRVQGADPLSDLAVIRMAASDLPVAQLGDASQLRVGQLVVAVGNPLGFAGSVTAGVVSAVGRSIVGRDGPNARVVDNVIQTDAALHPGNSGGALADSNGKVVGINTAVVGPGIGQGLGLAVPINETTRNILMSLMSTGRVRRAYLGVAGGSRPLGPRAAETIGFPTGFEVAEVVPGSAAAAAGVCPGDVIVHLDGEHIAGVADLQRLMTGERIDRVVPMAVFRTDRLVDLKVRLRELGTGAETRLAG